MASFTVRVELHDANLQHYLILAKDLASKSIVDVIAADNGVSYKLPPAEYNYEGAATIDAVYNAVVASAQKTGRQFAVFITEAVRRKWVGLQPAQSRRSA